jgi:hypothetical protein
MTVGMWQPRLSYSHGTVAGQKSKRRSRKRRSPGGAPRAVASTRREQRTQQQAAVTRQMQRANRQLGTEGERPPSMFGKVPVSELAILIGLVAIVVWLIRGGTAILIVGLVVITLAVLEFTAREHFAGYRSHATLLAAVPAVAIAVTLVSLVGSRRDRAPLLMAVAIPIFSLLFWLLRRRFLVARQARVARPPAP